MICPFIATDAPARMGVAAIVRVDAARQANDMHATCVSTIQAARPGLRNTTQA